MVGFYKAQKVINVTYLGTEPQEDTFTNLFQSLGQDDDVSKEIYELSEQFVCTLYFHKEVHDVNAVQYKMYYEKCGKCEGNQGQNVLGA